MTAAELPTFCNFCCSRLVSFVSIGASADHAAIAAASCARLQDRRTRVTEPNACPCGSERCDRVSGVLQLELAGRVPPGMLNHGHGSTVQASSPALRADPEITAGLEMTSQLLSRVTKLPVSASDSPNLQPWLELSSIIEGHAFCPVDRHGHIGTTRLSGNAVALVLKRLASHAGLDPAEVAGHSLRAGLATAAAAVERSRYPETRRCLARYGDDAAFIRSRKRSRLTTSSQTARPRVPSSAARSGCSIRRSMAARIAPTSPGGT